jgi:hypothetical protein
VGNYILEGNEVSNMENKSIMDMDIHELRIEVAMLRERCEQLKQRLDKAYQYTPHPIWNPATPPWTGSYSKCSKCGIELTNGLACGDPSCPTIVRVTSGKGK